MLLGCATTPAPDDPESVSRRASDEPRPDPQWIEPDSLLSQDELQRVYDVREAALRRNTVDI